MMEPESRGWIGAYLRGCFLSIPVGQAAFLRRHAASPARPEASKSRVDGSRMGATDDSKVMLKTEKGGLLREERAGVEILPFHLLNQPFSFIMQLSHLSPQHTELFLLRPIRWGNLEC